MIQPQKNTSILDNYFVIIQFSRKSSMIFFSLAKTFSVLIFTSIIIVSHFFMMSNEADVLLILHHTLSIITQIVEERPRLVA